MNLINIFYVIKRSFLLFNLIQFNGFVFRLAIKLKTRIIDEKRIVIE